MFHSKIFADNPKKIFEELNRPVTYILDDVKETVITENTYRAYKKSTNESIVSA